VCLKAVTHLHPTVVLCAGSWEAEPLLKKGDLADAIMWYETQDGHQTFVQREHSRACRRFGVNVPPDVFTVLA